VFIDGAIPLHKSKEVENSGRLSEQYYRKNIVTKTAKKRAYIF